MRSIMTLSTCHSSTPYDIISLIPSHFFIFSFQCLSTRPRQSHPGSTFSLSYKSRSQCHFYILLLLLLLEEKKKRKRKDTYPLINTSLLTNSIRFLHVQEILYVLIMPKKTSLNEGQCPKFTLKKPQKILYDNYFRGK